MNFIVGIRSWIGITLRILLSTSLIIISGIITAFVY